MHDDDWCIFKKFPTYAGAEVLKSLLESAGVPTIIEPTEKLISLQCEILLLVEKKLLHRAEWVTKNSDFSVDELIYLATGELPSPKKDK